MNRSASNNGRLEPLVVWLRGWATDYRMAYDWASQTEADLRQRAALPAEVDPFIVFNTDLLRFLKNQALPERDLALIDRINRERWEAGINKQGYTLADFIRAFALADDLVGWAVSVYAQRDALITLRAKVPGFSTGLYRQVLGEIEYINR